MEVNCLEAEGQYFNLIVSFQIQCAEPKQWKTHCITVLILTDSTADIEFSLESSSILLEVQWGFWFDWDSISDKG